MPSLPRDASLTAGGLSPLPLLPPAGMGDLLPPEAHAQRALADRVLRVFELGGYDVITPPLFEHAEVFERGVETLESRDLLRFVEPESGEVAVIRPDITPQIARIVATRLAAHPAPWRLCYQGRVIRRRHGRARRHRQIAQAGVECVGLAGADADAEVIALAARCCAELGLDGYRIELSHVSVAQSLLDRVPAEARPGLAEAVAHKDAAALKERLRRGQGPKRVLEQLAALIDCYGDADILRTQAKHLKWPAARAALRELRDIVEHLRALGLGDRIGVDLSEVRGFSYYTGASFSLLAPGPGEPLGAGGRYDNLLGRYGEPAPATGFSLDLDNLQWALSVSGAQWDTQRLPRLAIGGGDSAARQELARHCRTHGIAIATLPDSKPKACLAFARAWRYDGALVIGRSSVRALRASDGARRTWSTQREPALDELLIWMQQQG